MNSSEYVHSVFKGLSVTLFFITQKLVASSKKGLRIWILHLKKHTKNLSNLTGYVPPPS